MRSGFTLVEVLVAFTILAMGLMLIQTSFGDATRNRMTARDRAAAQALAPSIMALFGTVYDQAGSYSGQTADGRAWSLHARRLDREDGLALALPLFAIEARIETMSWGGQPAQIILRSIKPGAAS